MQIYPQAIKFVLLKKLLQHKCIIALAKFQFLMKMWQKLVFYQGKGDILSSKGQIGTF